MLTDAMVATFTEMSEGTCGKSINGVLCKGTRCWTGASGDHRPGSDVRTLLREDLLTRQGGICPVCGQDGTNMGAWEFNHVVARGPHVRGFVRGNVFAGHSSCNARTKPIYDNDGALISGVEVLPVSHFARADLIPNEWTPFPVLRRINRERKAAIRNAA